MSTPLTDDEIAGIRERLDSLSPEPWFVNPRTGEICYGDPDDDRDNYPIDNPEDFEFIAHARTDVPRLLDEIARLRARYDTEVRDSCETDTEIRRIARPVLGDAAVDGDSEHRPGLVDVVKAVIEFHKARADCAKAALDRMCKIVKVGPKNA